MILQNHALQAFHAVVETGTVHAASARLNLTQTAVTQRIKTLERDLGLTLFLRSRRGMALTQDGQALLQYSKAALELEGLFLSRVSGVTKTEVTLTLAGPTSAIATRVAENCRKLYATHPLVRFHLRSDDHSDRVDLVRRGEVDLAIVSPEQIPNEMESKTLKPDRYFLVASAKWKGRLLSDILQNERIIDFYESDPTTRQYLLKFGFANLIRRERLYVNENEALICLLKAGVGFGTLTEAVAKPHISSGDLICLNRSQVYEDPLALVWYKRTQIPPYFADLISAVK
jgi:LysR family transcriptional regulator (chromosome initiation inhibitor)